MNFKTNQEEQPDITHLSAQMARDNDRVACFIHGLIDHVDRLVSASKKNDWEEVRRVSEFLMKSSSVYELPEVARCAERVCRALDDCADAVEVKRSLLKLVGRCGSVSRRRPKAAGRKTGTQHTPPIPYRPSDPSDRT